MGKLLCNLLSLFSLTFKKKVFYARFYNQILYVKTCLRTSWSVLLLFFKLPDTNNLSIDQNCGDFCVIVRGLRALMTKSPLKQVQGSILSFFFVCSISLVDAKRFVFTCVRPSFQPVVVIIVWGELKHTLTDHEIGCTHGQQLWLPLTIYYPETEICVFMI